jgi:hypothetical protein
MSERPPSPTPQRNVPVPAGALRVVLFGMPDAGKSSLLGALSQAAQTQERALGGRLTDLTSGLSELQRRVYDEQPRETLEEIVLYPVTFEPFTDLKPDPDRRCDVVFIDCDGRVANDLLTRRRSLGDGPAGSLAREVIAADTLLLVVDASASPSQVEADFGEFVRFLRLLRQERGRRNEVGGFPVFLVLSKCDLLAKPEDAPGDWQRTIEARKAEVGQRFREFLDRPGDEDEELIPFGSVDLDVTATAVKRPALAGSAAQSREPVGVAEQFRQCLAAAQEFRGRRDRSQRRLLWTVSGATGLVACLLAFAAALASTRESIRPTPLAAQVESYRSREGPAPSVRLAEPLQRKLGELSDVAQDPDFPKLPEEMRQYVQGRLEELQRYRDYRDRLLALRAPADARDDEELRGIDRQLREDLAPPVDYAREWQQTEAVRLRDKYLEDVPAIRRAVGRADDWYRQLKQDADRLLLFPDRGESGAPLPWGDWRERVEQLFRQAERPPFRPTDKLPESKALPAARAATYATALAFPSVEQARDAWLKERQRLERLRDLTAALGLAGDAGRPAVLKIPEPPRFTVDSAHEVLQDLQKNYTNAATWTVADLPDVAAPEVRQAARRSYDHAIQAGRLAVLRRWQQIAPDGQETLARWQTVADGLEAARELRDWRELTNLLARLFDPQSADPVTALTTFLRQSRFELDPRGFRVQIPDDLKDQRFRPQGKLTLSVQNADRKVTSVTFRPEGDGVHDARRRVTTYVFTAEATGPVVDHPGDLLWAELPVRDADGREWKLSWWSVPIRSSLYQFERLTLPPRLYRPEQKVETGDVAAGVVLSPVPEGSVPIVPDLFPDLSKR